ncbi:acylneuraminate cytidylyltransferase [Synechococcus sp. BS55D]|uniref:acylneuraminate cytidylyltransferase n=1 Tax=Synechococcus sp. BS55D TaxID=2055943 RepID=UPI001375E4BB|nr:acylneuraminate cytidylyltransferase [Synechococcus sp. BS55D]
MYPALIPARGGSKGIPKKNIAKVGPLPLIARNIIALQSSNKVSTIYVSTDDREIASVASKYGATIIERPSRLSQDCTSTDEVIRHFLNHLQDSHSSPQWFYLSQITYPFLSLHQIDALYNAKTEYPSHDSYFAATSFHSFIWQSTNNDPSRYEVVNSSQHFSNRFRRQDSPEQLIELGSVYLISRPGFLGSGSRFATNPKPVLIPNAPLIEIDNPQDLDHAKMLEPIYTSPCATAPALKDINLIITDFDGVLTDNYVFSDSSGNETIRTSKSDSLAIKDLIHELGIQVLIVSSEQNASHVHRASKLGLELYQPKGDKGKFVSDILAKLSDTMQDPVKLLYIGNDTNDLPVIPFAHVFVCPSDAHPEVLKKADVILTSKGGTTVMRELLCLLNISRKK